MLTCAPWRTWHHKCVRKPTLHRDCRCKPKEIVKNSDGSLTMKYDSPSGEQSKDFDKILMATGRGPNTAKLGLESAGVQTDDSGCGSSHC